MIIPEMLKKSGECGLKLLTQVIQQTEVIPDDWRTGIMLLFYKGNGSSREC